MVKKSKKLEDNKLTNWYEQIPTRMITKYENPSFDQTKIAHPARILIIGATGSGKTTLFLEFIKRMRNTFSHIILCVRSIDEPLYKFFISKLEPEQYSVHENGEVPDLDKFKDSKEQIVCVFDDLILSNQKKIEDYFIRSRKVAKGFTLLYLSQSYYKIPKIIRLQASHLFIKKLASSRDLGMILKENTLNVSKEELNRIYDYATSEKGSFLMIDLEADESQKFRKNFLEIL
jgi:hypothetical protein